MSIVASRVSNFLLMKSIAFVLILLTVGVQCAPAVCCFDQILITKLTLRSPEHGQSGSHAAKPHLQTNRDCRCPCSYLLTANVNAERIFESSEAITSTQEHSLVDWNPDTAYHPPRV